MKVRAKAKFIDKEATKKAGKSVVRKIGDTFTVSEKRFEEIQSVGDFVEEVVEEKKPAGKAKADEKKAE